MAPPPAPPKKRRKRRPHGLSVSDPREVAEVQMKAITEDDLIHTEDESCNAMNAYMGKVYRQPFTGAIKMKTVPSHLDFCMVDLFSDRSSISGSVESLVKDHYCYRVIPMGYRTWIYHELFRTKQLMPARGAKDESLFAKAMSMRCVDAEVSNGKYSPVVAYMPISFVVAIGGDFIACTFSVAFLLLLYVEAKVFNDPGWYHFQRVATVILRAIYLVAILIWTNYVEETIAVISLWVAAVIVVADFVLGDINQLRHLDKLASYTIIEELPHRIFIVERHGADFVSKEPPMHIPQSISGYGKFRRSWLFVADIKGLLVELRPMTEDNWSALKYERQMTMSLPRPYLSMNMFSMEKPTLARLRTNDDGTSLCKHCGAPLVPTMTFCAHCGKSVKLQTDDDSDVDYASDHGSQSGDGSLTSPARLAN